MVPATLRVMPSGDRNIVLPWAVAAASAAAAIAALIALRSRAARKPSFQVYKSRTSGSTPSSRNLVTWAGASANSRNPSANALLLIAGGVGPRASIEVHAKILKNTITSGDDQSHLDVLHISAPARVSDRTAFIVAGGDVPGHPGEELAQLVVEAAQATRDKHPSRRIIIGVPCVTFHARMIFDGFERKLAEAFDDDRGSKVVLINLIDSICATFAADDDIRRICVLGTHGTVKGGTLFASLAESGLEPVLPDSSTQALLHESIYNKQWGLKSKSRVTEKARTNLMQVLQAVVSRGKQRNQPIDAILLACTELSFGVPVTFYDGVPIYDALNMLSRTMVAAVDPSKLEPLVEGVRDWVSRRVVTFQPLAWRLHLCLYRPCRLSSHARTPHPPRLPTPPARPLCEPGAGRLMIAWASRHQWCAAPVCSASSDVWRGSRS